MCGLTSTEYENDAVSECRWPVPDLISDIMESDPNVTVHNRVHPSQLAQPPGQEERENLVNLARVSAFQAQQISGVVGVYQNIPDFSNPPFPAIKVSSARQRSSAALLLSTHEVPPPKTEPNSPFHAMGRSGLPGSPTQANFRDLPGVFSPYQNIPSPAIVPKTRTPPIKPDLLCDHAGFDVDKNVYHGQTIRDRSICRFLQTGFYYGHMTAQEAKAKLRDTEVGTFLVRKSSDPLALASLSVKTHRGTTSIRILFANGYFRLDCGPLSVHKMSTFDCALKLIEHYVAESASDSRNKCVFLEGSGRRDTPVIMTRPLRNGVQSLKHLCRRAVHSQYSASVEERVQISVQLRQYLQEYPSCL